MQEYKCLYDKSDNGYKERDRVANAWAAVEMTLNLCDGNDDYSIFLFDYLLHIFFIYSLFLNIYALYQICISELSQYIFGGEARTSTNI